MFLMNCNSVGLHDLHPFLSRTIERTDSLNGKGGNRQLHCFGFCKKPLIHGARLDIQGNNKLGSNKRLCSNGTVNLEQGMEAAGSGFYSTEGVASLLGLRSICHTRDILNID